MKAVIHQFYDSFSKMDAEGMVNCYHEDIKFEDPAFGKLHGEHAKNMWRLLCASAKDLSIEASDFQATNDVGSAHWEAHYTFSQTERKVHNIIEAKFKFKEGKIIEHIDSFNLHSWATQAMGFKGWLLGGTGFFKKKLHEQTGRMLEKYEHHNS